MKVLQVISVILMANGVPLTIVHAIAGAKTSTQSKRPNYGVKVMNLPKTKNSLKNGFMTRFSLRVIWKLLGTETVTEVSLDM